MIPVYNLDEIENTLKKNLEIQNGHETSHQRMLLAGDINSILQLKNQSKSKSKVLGILFANPEVRFVQDEILHSLEHFHYRTSVHLDVFCGGFSAWTPKGENSDNKKIKTVDGIPWEYSAKAHNDLEDQIESMSNWKRNGETTLLLLEVKNENGEIKFCFDYCLDLNLEKMKEDKAITSVRSFMNDLTNILIKTPSNWATSDNFGKNIFKGYLKEQILSLLPDNLQSSYGKAEHFAVKNYRK